MATTKDTPPPTFPASASGTMPRSDTTDEMRRPRTLILCFDGTSNQFDGDNTNVVKFYSLLRKNEHDDDQLCYYQPGIGTYFNPGVVGPIFQWAAKIMDEAVAWYLDEHVRGGYQFLMQNYCAGDKICIFGFSRGAYTARALAGMLHKIGLLPRDNPEQIPFAYKLYKKTDADSLALAVGFKQTFCRTVQIEFMGVWDTVSSVGVLMGRTLPFTASNATIKVFRHALALDEHRAKFRPNLYHRPSPTSPTAGVAPSSSAAALTGKQRKKGKRTLKEALGFLRLPKEKRATDAASNPPFPPRAHSSISSASGSGGDDDVPGGTDVLEVWFAGCHSDVGGGAVPDGTPKSLAEVTLRWMVREVVLAQTGIKFDRAALARCGIPDAVFTGAGMPLPPNTRISPPSPHAHGEQAVLAQHASGTVVPAGPAKDVPPLEAAEDALQPIHDELSRWPFWWLLEIIPTSYTWQDADGTWHTGWSFHLGKGRDIPDIKPNFHVTVQERMRDPNLKYTPKAKWKAGTETYVV